VLDDRDQLVRAVAVLTREADELACARDHRAALGAAGDRDPAAAAEFEQSFVAKRAQRAENGVRVHAEHRGEIAGGRQALTRPGFAVRDRAADLCRHLFVQLGRVVAVDVDTDHGASNSSFIVTVTSPPRPPRPQPAGDPDALIKEARDRQRRRRRRVAAVLVVLALAGVAYAVDRNLSGGGPTARGVPGTPVVDASAFAGHGRLAFVSRRTLWVLDGSRGSVRRLPSLPGFYPLQPLFSPDGRWLAYLQTTARPSDVPDASPSWVATGDQLWLARADGSGARRVRSVRDVVLLGWSPTRDVLAVASGPLSRSAPYGVQTSLRLVSPDGSSRVLVRAPSVKNAVWSPAGDSLAVFTENGALVETLAVYRLAGGTPTLWLRFRPHDRLAGMSQIVIDAAGWWPGLGIGFWVFGNGMIHGNDAAPLAVVAAPAARPRLLARTLSDGTTRVIAAGPRGRLAIVADVANGGRVVWQAKQVELCGRAGPCTRIVRSNATVTVDPVWSPDGRTLAFVEAPNLSFAGWPQTLLHRWYGAHRLRLYDAATGRVAAVAAGRGATVPQWSEDGRSLLYVANDELWLLPSLTGKPVEIAAPLFARERWPAYYGQVAWTAQFAWTSRQAALPAATAARRTVRFHLLGFGTALPTSIDSGPCPQGRTEIAIVSTAGQRIGTAHLCVRTISKLDVPGYGVKRIVQTVLERDSLPGGTIVSRQTQRILFARDQRHTVAIFRGRVVGGTGRYSHARGTVGGGGRAVDGQADWVVTVRLR
jgi:Tol biopolymer transport system component